jgi:hypothetical protein
MCRKQCAPNLYWLIEGLEQQIAAKITWRNILACGCAVPTCTGLKKCQMINLLHLQGCESIGKRSATKNNFFENALQMPAKYID